MSEFNPPDDKAPVNVTLPDTSPVNNPELFATSVFNENPVTVVSFAVVIDISELSIGVDKFCWLIINNISLSVAVLEDADTNENTCESDVTVNNLALAPVIPSLPPSILKILVISLTDSFSTSIEIGNFVLSPPRVPLKVIDPLICPVPDVDDDINVGLVIVVPPESFIVILAGSGELDKFWWLIITNISLSIASFDDALGKENTCESDVTEINFALDPSLPSCPALDLANDIILVNDVLPLVAVISIDPVSPVNPVTVIVLLTILELTPVPFVLENE